MKTTNKIKAIALFSVVVLSGVFFFAKQYVNGYAAERVEAFLIQNDLNKVVKYNSVSASVFGNACMNDVSISDSDANIQVGSICVENFGKNNGSINSLSAVATDISVPLIPFANNFSFFSSGSNNIFYRLFALGITEYNGKLTFDYDYDPSDHVANLLVSTNFGGVGAYSVRISLDNVNNSLFDVFTRASNAFSDSGGNHLLAGLAALDQASSISNIGLSEYEVTLNNSQYVDRLNKIETASTPEDKSKWGDLLPTISKEKLIKGGMMPSAADSFISEYNEWKTDGGEIVFCSELERAYPVFNPKMTNIGLGSTFSIETFFAGTNSRASM